MARWDLRKPLDEAWSFGAADGSPWRGVPDVDSETDDDDDEDDEDAEMTVRDDSGEGDAKVVEDEDLGTLGLGLEGMEDPEVGDEGYDSDDVEIHMVWG
ncbi:hypothetical protein BN14_12410 [Rhizoctonia solani AG-1 IB]|uniref:Uncharacterized protein n=1 Tax=Thanatephorus cucumeris (strain AG1-IB / isolate 7/3/14) TaxID=1108050 RepID=M5CHP8_THACB|nr:hypothetical protein BN14_12410 [Rhizoctonia solani AG-1 IB]